MTVGTEHEYSINDAAFHPLPISDRLMEILSGSVRSELPFGEIELSKELQKHVLEIVPRRPAASIAALESTLYGGLKHLHAALDGRCRFLGLGMHPLLRLTETAVWDHEEKEIYEAYHRLFDLRQHGWLNIQALQINIPYADPVRMTGMFNRIRALIPYLVAVTAASPCVEGRLTGCVDNRIHYYRINQAKIPDICRDLIPERIRSLEDYQEIQQAIYRQLKEKGAEILCREWVNSRGVIVRFSRQCLEIKAMDEQECIRSDMAITAFVLALLRNRDLDLDDEESALRALIDSAMRRGTEPLRPELRRLYAAAVESATDDERAYLPLVAERIERGSVGEIMAREVRKSGDLHGFLERAEQCLWLNTPLRERT
ncbi:MAG: glutamate-cysteine ligase family protein [Methanomicrobiales archaeon]|nr:glutamate-cysteine ligase family protein [Methanomicrobiales archaeon]MDI6876341.1 glutamate-cysteine ligase family protein [Methanomicrobiales archaeon]